MKNLGKISFVSLILGVGLLLIDLLASILALTIKPIGISPEWQIFVMGLTITALGFLTLAIVLGIVYFIINILK